MVLHVRFSAKSEHPDSTFSHLPFFKKLNFKYDSKITSRFFLAKTHFSFSLNFEDEQFRSCHSYLEFLLLFII